MGNLTDIGYGVGKYLTISDGSGIPDIGTNRKNLDLLNFKVATNNAYSLYNFKDGIVDAYVNETGVDTSASTNESYNAAGDYYSSTVIAAATTAFTSTGASTYTCPAGITQAEILIVAGGGGGGGYYYGGGGGAGGIVHDSDYTLVPAVVYDITVGTAGAGGGGTTRGTTGADSVWNVNAEGSGITLTANGGGGAGSYGDSPARDGFAGGSGGGAGATPGTAGATNQPSFSGATSYGFAGGSGGGNAGSGGGGASEAGNTDGPATGTGDGGDGGDGQLFSSFTSYGVSGYFGGGGGGGSGNGPKSFGPGGTGGGGNGAEYNSSASVAGTANTGGGGGGGSYHIGSPNTQAGASGGTGVVIVKTAATTTNMTLISNAQTAQTAPTEGRLMIFEETSTGSTTLDTDLKGYVSRDGGSNWTQTPLTLDTTYETGKTAVSGSVDISGQPAGTDMKYKVETLNQSASKVCRLHGASLLWG